MAVLDKVVRWLLDPRLMVLMALVSIVMCIVYADMKASAVFISASGGAAGFGALAGCLFIAAALRYEGPEK